MKAADTGGTVSAASVPLMVAANSSASTDCTTAYTVTSGWGVTWVFGGDQRIDNAWNGVLTQIGQTVTARDAGYNATLAPGGAVDIGFTAAYRTSNVVPYGFRVNGTVCAAA
ncbi:cellulose binding domain-containing protein [Streptomyces sp. NPDC093221]|uniref:cellulose binding domain-containing protein n=1 Tax=Streptomyces sp. NPDC093221 TaxID=3366032 RepID=UPI0037F2846F